MQRAADSATDSDRPTLRDLVNFAQVSQDWPLQLASDLADATFNQGAGAQKTIEGPAIADAYAHLHDPAHAMQYMALSDPDDPITKSEENLLPGYAALELSDAATLSRRWKGSGKSGWQIPMCSSLTMTNLVSSALLTA